MCCSYMNFLCWIHFCRMPSCKWHRFSTNRKLHNGCHRTSAIHIFVIFVYNFFVWSHRYIGIYLRCIVFMIWDTTTINGTRYVIERSWVRAPPGVCYFPPHKMSIVSRPFVSQPLQVYIYIYIYIYTHAALLWQFDTWPPSIESKMAKKLMNNIKLKRAINPNPLWRTRQIRFPRKIFNMGLSLWHMNKKQNALAPPNELALIAWTKLQLFVQGFTNK